MLELNRRKIVLAMFLAAILVNTSAHAKDGDSGGGGNSGSGNSGSGSDNSGSDSDSDDDDNDDDDDDDDNEDNSGSRRDDQNRALQAVKNGKAVSLRKLKSYLDKNHPGKILGISLQRKSGKYVYRVRILSSGNRIKTLSLNALTLSAGGA